MSHSLIDHSADLKRLEEDGYEIAVESNHLVMKHVPYVAADGSVKYGTLVSELTLAGDVTAKSKTHVMMFAGEMPCDRGGRPLTQIRLDSERKDLGGGLIVDRSFSSKPPEGYSDYHQKMTTYEAIISGPAQVIDPAATARTFAVLEGQEEDSVFRYIDTASTRAGIGTVTEN